MNTDRLKAKIKCRSIRNPILSKVLERDLDVPGAVIRDGVRALRREGVPVGACSDGYFMAESFAEIEPTIMDLKSRIQSLSVTAKKLGQAFNIDIQTDLFT